MFWDNFIKAHTDRLQEQFPAAAQATLVPLRDYAFISVEGPDAIKFLQGQCTCDFNALENTRFILGAHCTPKGRMLATFTAAKIDEDAVLLRLQKGIAENTLNALKKYAAFSKVSLSLQDTWLSFAIINEQHSEQQTPITPNKKDADKEVTLQHAPSIKEVWFNTKCDNDVLSQYSQLPIYDTQQYWELKNIERGVAELNEPLVEKLLPQEINFQFVNGISFKKGCYTGQEIIARVHYRLS